MSCAPKRGRQPSQEESYAKTHRTGQYPAETAHRPRLILVIAGTLNYLDRSTLSIANPLIRQEWGLSIADMGLLLSAASDYAFAVCANCRVVPLWIGWVRTGCLRRV